MKKFFIPIITIFKKHAVVHPVLLAVFPFLFLYTQNINQTSASTALSPLWYAIPGTIILWLLLYVWMRNIFKAGIVATLFLIIFFGYGRFYTFLEEHLTSVPNHNILLPILILVWGYLAYFLKRAGSDFSNATRVLNLISVVLILINVFNIIYYYQIDKPDLPDRQAVLQTHIAPASATSKEVKPDIYFIILDEYANPGTMKDLYHYDDSEFLKNLESQGFYVATDSHMHNDETIRAVASILNMEYTPESEPTEVSYQRIENNAVVSFLRSAGYQYVYFGQWYEEDRYQIQADKYYNFYEAAENDTLTPEYSAVLWNTTALSPFYNYLFGEEYEGYYRNGLLNTLNQLKKVPEIPGPKFIYAHLVCPHAPFIFGPNGEQIASVNYYNLRDAQYYLGQYIFISREIDKVIAEILKNSSTDPIIILQSDHGPRWTDQWEKILNAYHLPGDCQKLLYQSISPVNSFRLIFNHYFQAHYAILEDR